METNQPNHIEWEKTDPELKKVTRLGNSAHIAVPKKYLDMTAEFSIIKPKAFMCQHCWELFERPEHFSPVKGMCSYCYAEKDAEENDKCQNCGKSGVKLGMWGHCEKCWDSNEFAKDSSFVKKVNSIKSPKVDLIEGKNIHEIKEKLKEEEKT